MRGEALARAFERSGRFAPLDCGVLRIGEQTGRLDEALAFLADYYRKRIAQRRMVSGAVSYPLIILFTAIVVVIFMVLVDRADVRAGLLAHGRRTADDDPVDHLAVEGFPDLSDRRGARGAAENPIVVEDLWRTDLPCSGIVCGCAAEDVLWRATRCIKERAGPFLPPARPACFLRSPAVAGHRDARGDHRVLSLPRSPLPEVARELERGACLSEALERFAELYDRRLVTLLKRGRADRPAALKCSPEKATY